MAAQIEIRRFEQPDDCLDAVACAWTATRWARGEAEVLGDEVDALGVPMRIIA